MKTTTSKPAISKKQATIIIIIATLLLIFAASKLLSVGKSDLIGTWVCTSDPTWTISFYENGAFYDTSGGYIIGNSDDGEWKLSNGELLFRASEKHDWRARDYELSNNVLRISDVNDDISFFVKVG